MHVCIVTHVVRLTDGQGRVNYEIGRYLADQGHKVTFVCSSIDPELASRANVDWREIRVPANWPDILAYQVFARRAYRSISAERDKFDILHLNGAITFGPSDVNACHFVHSHWVHSPYHTSRQTTGLYSWYQKIVTMTNAFWEKKAYGQARKVVAVSRYVSDSLEHDVGIDGERVHVIHNGVDLDEFAPGTHEERLSVKAELGIPEEAFVMMFSGGIKTNRKNLDLPLRSLTGLGPHVRLIVAGTDGGGPYPAMASELGVADRVHFLGHREDLPRLMRGADVFAFPSHYDPFPLVVGEAMASGLPVITCPTTGASVLITHGISGYILDSSSDLVGMIDAVRRLDTNRHASKRMGLAARETAEQHSWSRMAGQYLDLYLSLAGGNIGSESQPGTQK